MIFELFLVWLLQICELWKCWVLYIWFELMVRLFLKEIFELKSMWLLLQFCELWKFWVLYINFELDYNWFC